MNDLFSTQHKDDTLIITINGPLDGISAPYLQLDPLPEESRVILHCQHISFMDSAGIAAVVRLFKDLQKAEKKMIIAALHGQPKDLVETLQLGDAIEVVD